MSDGSDGKPQRGQEPVDFSKAGYWNCRIVRTRDEDDGNKHLYGVHEVFYSAEGKPVGWACSPCLLQWESKQDLLEYMDKVAQAGSRPVLDAETLTDVKEEEP